MPAGYCLTNRCLAWVATLLFGAAVCQSAEPPAPGARGVVVGRVAVLVLPFEQISAEANQQESIGLALQRSVAADLGEGADVRVLLQQAPPLADAVPAATTQPAAAPGADSRDDARVAAALAAGRGCHAAFVVCGEYQVLDRRLRVTGQVLDVETGEAVGHLKVTGPMEELFEIQDELGEQVLDRLQLPVPEDNDAAPAASYPGPRIYDPAETMYDYSYPPPYYSSYGGSPYFYSYPFVTCPPSLGIRASAFHHRHDFHHQRVHLNSKSHSHAAFGAGRHSVSVAKQGGSVRMGNRGSGQSMTRQTTIRSGGRALPAGGQRGGHGSGQAQGVGMRR